MGDEDIRILKVEKDNEDGLIVTFSDGTIAGYVPEELLVLRPCPEPIEEPVGSNYPAFLKHGCAMPVS